MATLSFTESGIVLGSSGLDSCVCGIMGDGPRWVEIFGDRVVRDIGFGNVGVELPRRFCEFCNPLVEETTVVGSFWFTIAEEALAGPVTSESCDCREDGVSELAHSRGSPCVSAHDLLQTNQVQGLSVVRFCKCQAESPS